MNRFLIALASLAIVTTLLYAAKPKKAGTADAYPKLKMEPQPTKSKRAPQSVIKTPAPRSAKAAPEPTPLTVFKKTESHKFSGLKLKGQLKKPDLTFIYERKGLRAEQILDIPEDFNAEVIEGASQF